MAKKEIKGINHISESAEIIGKEIDKVGKISGHAKEGLANSLINDDVVEAFFLGEFSNSESQEVFFKARVRSDKDLREHFYSELIDRKIMNKLTERQLIIFDYFFAKDANFIEKYEVTKLIAETVKLRGDAFEVMAQVDADMEKKIQDKEKKSSDREKSKLN